MANPNPSPETRFGAENGNPSGGGRTKAQRQAEVAAAEKAAILRDKMLSEVMERVEAGESAFALIDANILKLFKDSEDRAHGTPTATIAGDPERPLIAKVVRQIVRPDNSDR